MGMIMWVAKREREIISKLNILTKMDFVNNYDKGEVARMFAKDTKEMELIKEDIHAILSIGMLDDKIGFYSIKVNNNFVTIYKIIEKSETSEVMQELYTIWASDFYKLPIAWVNGKKISKKACVEVLESML